MSALVTDTPDSAAMTPSCRGGAHKRCTTDENGCGCRCHRVGAEIQAMEDAAAGLIETLLREWFADKSGFVPAIEAQKFVAAMREQHPTELAAWLQDRAEWLVIRLAGDRLRDERKLVRGSRGNFAAYAKAMEAGGDVPETVVGALDVRYRVAADNTQRALRDMTAVDLRFVVTDREKEAAALKLEAAVLRAIAKRLPDDKTKVGDVLDEHQVYEIRKKLQPKGT